MSTAALAIVLFIALGGLAVVLNNCLARLALVELMLNEGLPPGHQHHSRGDIAGSPPAGALLANPAELLPVGVHMFLSRNCHACQRLVEELGQVRLDVDASIHLHYVDRPRPIATSAAHHQNATLHEHQHELAAQLHADPLPFTIAIGAHGLVSRAVTPTVPQVVVAVRDAGFAATRSSGTSSGTRP